MKSTTTAQNQTTATRGRDLGQITVKATFCAGSKEYNTEACWLANVTNKDGYVFCVIPSETTDKSDYIQAGYKFREGYSLGSEPSTFKLCMALADLTSTSKHERQYAKERVKAWADDGKAIYALAVAAIEGAQS